METLALDLSSVRTTTDTAAERAARRNLAANRAALRLTQPDLVVNDPAVNGEWVFGRDGSLTALAPDGWLAGCSLPARAARQHLKTMDVRGPAGCFLDPPHAAHLRVALGMLGPHQALVALFPGHADLGSLLSCHDLSADIAAHRLWIVAGDDWPDRLRRLFRDRPGLPTPTHFVRLTGGEPGRLDPVIAEAQRALGSVTAERSAAAERLSKSWRPKPANDARIAVAAGRRFKLWDDAAAALAEVAATDGRLQAVCADDPLTAGTLALLAAAVEAGAVMLADVGRSDLPDLFPREMPWVTWATTPRLPAAAGRGPNDSLLVADPAWRDAAVAAGWPAAAVTVAAWPVVAAPPTPAAAPPHLAVFADLPPTDPPERLDEFSSHRLLWNAIRAELSSDPFAAGADAEAYLRSRLDQFNVDPAKLDRPLFVRNLIEPTTAVGVVRTLARAGLAVRVHGDGWEDAFAAPTVNVAVVGRVTSRDALRAAAAAATAVVDVRPVAWRNGLWSLGRQVVTSAGRSAAAVVRDAGEALAGRGRVQPLPQLSAGVIAAAATAGLR